MKCRYCFQEYDPEVRKKISYDMKVKNAHATNKKMKERGTRSGPKSKLDWESARKMRKKYYSFTEIAKAIGTNRTYVSHYFKRQGWK